MSKDTLNCLLTRTHIPTHKHTEIHKVKRFQKTLFLLSKSTFKHLFKEVIRVTLMIICAHIGYKSLSFLLLHHRISVELNKCKQIHKQKSPFYKKMFIKKAFIKKRGNSFQLICLKIFINCSNWLNIFFNFSFLRHVTTHTKKLGGKAYSSRISS